MLLDRLDDAGVDVRSEAGFDHHAALAAQRGHFWIIEQGGAVADPLGSEDLDRLADLAGWSPLAGVDRPTEAPARGFAEGRAVVGEPRPVLGKRTAGQIDPDHIVTPGIFVDRLVKLDTLDKRIEQRTVRRRVAAVEE